MAKKPERGLGRGLQALMADINADSETSVDDTKPGVKPQVLPIEKIKANKDQPRSTFDHNALDDLAQSIATRGVIQPIIVRPLPGSDGDYQIVAGERRWRAAQIAKLHEMPVIVRDYTDLEVVEVAIIENIQRDDLNPVDEAIGYLTLMESHGHTQEQVSHALGKSRSYIANMLRLLQLPTDVQRQLALGGISVGHARALVTAEDPVALMKIVMKKGLSVRETEALVKKGAGEAKAPRAKAPEKSSDTRAIEADLSANLGMKVSIDHQDRSGKGVVTIQYKDLDGLDQLLSILSGGRPGGSK